MNLFTFPEKKHRIETIEWILLSNRRREFHFYEVSWPSLNRLRTHFISFEVFNGSFHPLIRLYEYHRRTSAFHRRIKKMSKIKRFLLMGSGFGRPFVRPKRFSRMSSEGKKMKTRYFLCVCVCVCACACACVRRSGLSLSVRKKRGRHERMLAALAVALMAPKTDLARRPTASSRFLETRNTVRQEAFPVLHDEKRKKKQKEKGRGRTNLT